MSSQLDAVIQQSLVLISTPSSAKFGSGFVFYQDSTNTWIATCKHVLKDVGVELQVNHQDNVQDDVEVLHEADDIDLAILKVKKTSQAKSLTFLSEYPENMCFALRGFYENLVNKSESPQLIETLKGNLVKSVDTLSSNGGACKNRWKLNFADNSCLKKGYSGAPLVCPQTFSVIAIASNKTISGEKGYAIPIQRLYKMLEGIDKPVYLTLLLKEIFKKHGYTHASEELLALCQALSIKIDKIDFFEILEQLGSYGKYSYNNQAPLLRVVNHIQNEIVPSLLKTDLENWLNSAKTHYHISNIAAIQPNPAPFTPSLLVDFIHCHDPRKRLYETQLWFFGSDSPECVGEPLQVSLQKKDSEFVDKLIEAIPNSVSDHHNFRLEFALPDVLINTFKIQHWKDSTASALGYDYQIVVRSKQRLQDPKLQRFWKFANPTQNQFWNTLSQIGLASLDKVRFIKASEIETFTGSTVGQVLAEFLIVEFPSKQKNFTKKHLTELIKRGASIMLFCHEKFTESDCRDELKQAGCKEATFSLENLPHLIRKIRCQAQDDDTQLGYHLVLLWDDPRRLPDTQLTPPAKLRIAS